jgi:hypothetical protein
VNIIFDKSLFDLRPRLQEQHQGVKQRVGRTEFYARLSFNEVNDVRSDYLGFSIATACTPLYDVTDWKWCQE